MQMLSEDSKVELEAGRVELEWHVKELRIKQRRILTGVGKSRCVDISA